MTTHNSKAKSPLNTAEMRRLKGIGHKLKPVVSIGNNGISDAVIDEINRALTDHELIKIKVPAGSKQDREELSQAIAQSTDSQIIHHIGRMLLLLRHNPQASPRLSNLARYSE